MGHQNRRSPIDMQAWLNEYDVANACLLVNALGKNPSRKADLVRSIFALATKIAVNKGLPVFTSSEEAISYLTSKGFVFPELGKRSRRALLTNFASDDLEEVESVSLDDTKDARYNEILNAMKGVKENEKDSSMDTSTKQDY